MLDVADPSQPREVGRQADSGWTRLEDEPEVRLTGDLAVIAGGRAGLRVADVSGPAIREVGAIDPPDGAFEVAVDGELAYVAAWSDGLRIMNVTDPAAAREVGVFDPAGYVVDVALADGYAFVAASTDGLRVLDVREPTQPREVGFFEIPDWNSGESLQEGLVTGVDVVGGYAYITSSDVGLTVLDVRDPANPEPVGQWEGEYRGTTDVHVRGGVAYLDGWTRLELVDVSEASEPRHLGTFDVPVDSSRPGWTGVQDLAVDGDTVYVAAGETGVLVVDASDPTRARLLQRIKAPACSVRSGGTVLGVEASGGSLWLALGWDCIYHLGTVVTTEPEARPGDWCFRGTYDLPGVTRRIVVVGDRTYVAASYGGLWILRR